MSAQACSRYFNDDRCKKKVDKGKCPALNSGSNICVGKGSCGIIMIKKTRGYEMAKENVADEKKEIGANTVVVTQECKAFYGGTRCENKCRNGLCPGAKGKKCISRGFDGPAPFVEPEVATAA